MMILDQFTYTVAKLIVSFARILITITITIGITTPRHLHPRDHHRRRCPRGNKKMPVYISVSSDEGEGVAMLKRSALQR